MLTNLETPRFRLQPVGPKDLHYYLDLDSDPAVMKHLNGGRPGTVEECQGGLDRTQAVFARYQHKFGIWFAFEKQTNDFVGWVLFRPDKKQPDNLDFIELGYRLKRKWWGKKVATELAEHMVDYGFNVLGVQEIFADTLVNNFGSQGVMKKIGMTFSHEFDHDEIIGDTNRCVRYLLKNPKRS